jgi:uncharacterized protein (TIGR03083 family)
MPETPQRLAERLASESQKTLEFFRALSPEQWDCVVYPQGPVWTARHLLAHFVSAEQAITRLIEDIYRGGAGAPEGFDIDGFNAAGVAEFVQRAPDELLAEFEASRRRCVELVEQMQPADLSNNGRHPFLGWVTLEDIIKMLYRHDQIHLRDLRRLLKPDAADPAG